MENVVVSIFPVESEAFQAFIELRQQPEGEGYKTVEAVLLKNKDGVTAVQDCFAMRPVDKGETEGLLLGTLVGFIGGPLGILLGASYGAFVGGSVDMAKAVDQQTAVEILAGKIYEGETAIVALVQEEEPAFDAAYSKYEAAIIRYDAADIMEQVDHAEEVQAELAKEALKQLRADRKVERAERREARRADIKAQINEYNETAYKMMGYE